VQDVWCVVNLQVVIYICKSSCKITESSIKLCLHNTFIPIVQNHWIIYLFFWWGGGGGGAVYALIFLVLCSLSAEVAITRCLIVVCNDVLWFILLGSLHAHSLAASRVEQALSEVASSLSSFTPRPGPQRAWLLQLQIWLLLAEIYLSLEQVSDATSCIEKASSIFPLSHHIMYMVSGCYKWTIQTWHNFR